MHRLSKDKLLRYKKRLEADQKAYGYIIYACESSRRTLASAQMNMPQQTNRYVNRVALRHVARLYEYENVLIRLEEIE